MVNSTLMVIDPSITHPEIASFNKIVRHCPFPCTYHLPAMSSMDSFSRTLSNSCGLIILGSAASVHDQSDWQSKLGSILNKAIKLLGNGSPVAILMKTEMGNGVDFMMNTHAWHGKAPNDEQLKIALLQNPETLGDF